MTVAHQWARMTGRKNPEWLWESESENEHEPAHKEQLKRKKEQRTENWLNNNDNQRSNGESESGAQLAQQHTICHHCGEKGHHASDCPMKDKIAKNNWAMKKGMQMVQNLNDGAMAEANRPNNDNKSSDINAK